AGVTRAVKAARRPAKDQKRKARFSIFFFDRESVMRDSKQEKQLLPFGSKPNPDCRDMVAAYLREHGFDGLFCDECGCSLDDLMPCGTNDWAWACQAGHIKPGCTEACGQGCDFHIVPEKPLVEGDER
ncbi:hypothetical protein, partial [Thiolapillus sp.]